MTSEPVLSSTGTQPEIPGQRVLPGLSEQKCVFVMPLLRKTAIEKLMTCQSEDDRCFFVMVFANWPGKRRFLSFVVEYHRTVWYIIPE